MIEYDCKYQVAWSTKYGKTLLTGEIKDRLSEMIPALASDLDATISDLMIEPDKVVFFVSVEPRVSIHRVVKHIKARTSAVLREEFSVVRSKTPSLWTNSYLVITVGKVSPSTIKRFFDDQKGI